MAKRCSIGRWLGCLALLLVACGGPHPTGEGPFTALTLEVAEGVLAAQATVGYDAHNLEFVGAWSEQADILVAAHADGGQVTVALVSGAAPVRGALAQLVFRAKGSATPPTLTAFTVVDQARHQLTPPPRPLTFTPLPTNLAAGYNLQARAAALASGQQGVHTQPDELLLEASFADYPLGDTDQSGEVTLLDVVTIAAFAAQGESATPTPYQRYHSDLLSNGVINALDVVAALLKLVDPSLEADLQVAPRRLQVEVGASGLVLVGNAGRRPLPEIALTTPPDVRLTDISHEGAVGRVYRVEATAPTVSGAIVFDAGRAGTQVVALGAAFDPALCEAHEPNDSHEQATLLEPGTLFAALCPADDIDAYRLTLEASAVVTLAADIPAGSSLTSLHGSLSDAQDNPIGTLFAYRNHFETGSQPFAAYLPAGDYVLMLTGYAYEGDELNAVYRLRFDREAPDVPTVFEASAGTAVFDSPYGSAETNLIALSARQPDGTSLPFDVLVYLELPDHRTIPLLYPVAVGPSLYLITDFANPAPPVEPAPPPDPEPASEVGGQLSLRHWLDTLPHPPSRAQALVPAAVLGGSYRFIFPDTTVERSVDSGQQLEYLDNVTATLADDRASVRVRADPVPGALEYTVAVETEQGQGLVFVVSDSPDVTVVLSDAVADWERLFVTVIAADFRGLVDPVRGNFGFPIPDRQLNLSATTLFLSTEPEPDVVVQPGESVQAAIDAAPPGSWIVLMPGLYREAVTIDKPGIRLEGAGDPGDPAPDEGGVVLENPGGEDNGVTVTPAGDGVAIHNLTVRNYGQNGIFLEEVEGFVLSEVAAHNNGEYGFYPIRSSQGRIENCTASGHSDAGVYVGRRSHDIIIQNCRTFENVTGIEITNSSSILAVDNESFNNAAGFFVALLPGFPGAPPISVSDIVLSGNLVYDNNLPNFADHGLEQYIPSGSGMLIIGSDDTLIEYNTVRNNAFVGIAVGNTGLLAELAGVEQGDIEPFPDRVQVLANQVTGNGGMSPSPIPFLPPDASVDLLWDGTGRGNCWQDNTFDSSLNLDLPGGSPGPALPACWPGAETGGA